jgi:dTDP-4-amino-4,6-dideoxygalactose transaminase
MLMQREIADLPRRIAHRRRIAAAYRERLQGSALRHVAVPVGADPVYGRFPVFTPHKTELLQRAPDFRVELSDWYATPVHPLTGAPLEAAGYRMGSCPNAEQLTAEVVSLPTGLLVDEAQVDRAARLFRDR